MPFLREAPDDTLASTLGNLGSALGTALNPMNQFRAQDVLAQIQQRQWEIQQARRNDAANQNAAAVFRAANPLGMDDASKEAAAVAISEGRYDPSQWMTATTGLAKFRAAQAASDAVATDPDVQGYTPAEQSSVKSLVLNGTSLADAKSQVATERANANKTSQTLAATDAAATPFSKEAAASGQPDMAVQLDAGNTLLNQPPITGPLTDPDTQTALNKRNILLGQAKIPVQPDAGEAANEATAKLTQESLGAQAKPRAPTEIVPAVAPTNPLTGKPDASGGFAQAGAGPDPNAIAASTSAEAQAKNTSEYAAGVLQGGIQEGQGAQKVLNDVNQLRYLASVMNNDGPMNQIQNKLADEMYQRFGLTTTGSESARQVFNNYVAALMGEWRHDVGIQRLALPEIQLGQLSLPNPNMSLDALNSALDFVQAKAQISDKVGNAALRYWTDKTAPLEDRANTFLGERSKLYAPEANPAATIKQERVDKATVNSPTGPKHYRIVGGQRVEIPNPQ